MPWPPVVAVAEPRHRIDPEGRPYAPEGLEVRQQVTAAHLAALDLRIGTVTDVAPFPAARDPAYQVSVDFGPVVGVLRTSAKITNYDPDALRGRQVVGAINLGSRRIAGFESQFLLLGGLTPEGTVHLLAPDAPLPDGAPVA